MDGRMDYDFTSFSTVVVISQYTRLRWMDGWSDGLRFYILFNSGCHITVYKTKMDGWMDGRMDYDFTSFSTVVVISQYTRLRWMDGWMDGWIAILHPFQQWLSYHSIQD